MIEYIEVNPLPQVCQECEEQQKRYFAADPEEQLRMEREGFNCDCGSCENAGYRWILSREDELWLMRKAKIKAIQRLQSELAKIDTELSQIIEAKKLNGGEE